MARTGFFYLGIGEAVRCYFCNTTITEWQPDDDIVTRHLIACPHCPLINRNITYNRPTNIALFNKDVPPTKSSSIQIKYSMLQLKAEHREYLTVLDTFKRLYLTAPWTRKNEKTTTLSYASTSNHRTYHEHIQYVAKQTLIYTKAVPLHPQFQDPITRYKTLIDMNLNTIPPEIIAMAGLFAQEDQTQTTCFFCGWQYHKWEAYDDPWSLHGIWSPGCRYIHDVRGPEFIAFHRQQLDIIFAIQQGQKAEDKSDNTPKHMCTVCHDKPVQTVFLPCGHACACTHCARVINITKRRCPMCRDFYIIYQDIYLP